MTKSKSLRFPGGSGTRLAARLDQPRETPIAHVLFAHCFTCTKDYKAVRRISQVMAEHGYAVMSFDFTGLGDSKGDFAATTFSSNLDDLEAAAEYLARSHGEVGLLVGHSLGGAAVLGAAGRLPSVRAVATIAAPSDTSQLARRLDPAAEAALHGETFTARIGDREIRLGKELVEDLRDHELHPRISALSAPLLILHSPSDDVVGIEHARRIYRLATHPKSFVSLGNADHLLARDPADAEWVGHMLAAWARRYV